MTSLLDPARPPTQRTGPRAGGWFRAFWRWHFYAAFLVAPVLLVLATTGLVYLFRFQLEPLLHADLMRADRPAGAATYAPYAQQEAAVETAYPSLDLVSMSEPREAGATTVFTATTPGGEDREVYVDPWTAQVLGDLDPTRTVSGLALEIHGTLMAGALGDAVIELAACWAVVMAVTGYYLLVKGRRARKRARGAGLRRTHGRLGAVAGVGLLLLVVSGLPWTGLWGGQVQRLASGQGSSLFAADPGARSNLQDVLPQTGDVPWAAGASPVPSSGHHHGGGSSTPTQEGAVTLDGALAAAGRADVRRPATVALPQGEDGVFSVIADAHDAPSEERTVHVDRFDASVVATYGYDDYPALAKVVSQGIGLHEGRSLGPVSFVGAALTCLAVIAACVSGPLMWWRRRPDGSLGAPRGRLPLRSSPVLLVGLVALGLLLPLFGASVVLVLALDRLVLRRVPRLGRWFGVTGGSTGRPLSSGSSTSGPGGAVSGS